MRKILFKAKKLDNGKWVEGYYYTDLDNNHFIRIAKNNRIGSYKIDPNTLCQFTGLTDKNGNKIWENDIIDLSSCWWNTSGPAGYESPIVLVAWDECCCGFDPFANYDCGCGIYYEAKNVKVIGNKFDNFELLEGDN